MTIDAELRHYWYNNRVVYLRKKGTFTLVTPVYESLPGSINISKKRMLGITWDECLPVDVRNELVAYYIFNDIG